MCLHQFSFIGVENADETILPWSIFCFPTLCCLLVLAAAVFVVAQQLCTGTCELVVAAAGYVVYVGSTR